MTIAVDFDGTIVRDEYPEIGKEMPFAVSTLKMLMRDGHQLVLWTVRRGELLQEAVEWCHRKGIEFYAINKNYPEEDREQRHQNGRKLKVDIFIDDRNIGGLLSWGDIYEMISQHKTYRQLLCEQSAEGCMPKKRHWWQR